MKIFTKDNVYDGTKFPETSFLKQHFKRTEEGIATMSDTIQRLFREDLDKARKEAREEGREEGRQETVSLIARNLLGLKVSHDRIPQITGLSLAEVKTLAVTG